MKEMTSLHVTRLLGALNAGDAHASDELLPILYDELRQLAQARLSREPPGQTLQATALVHEAYLRLLGDSSPTWQSRGHFFAAAAEAMRRILIERARRYRRIKHGGGFKRVELNDAAAVTQKPAIDLLALDEALTGLEKYDARKAQIVKLRFFAGLSIADTAAAMDLSPATVKTDWAYARSWLHRELAQGDTAAANEENDDPSSQFDNDRRMKE